MSGIKNMAIFLYENWTSILFFVCIVLGIIKKTVDFFAKSKQEKIAIIKKHIAETMLKMISDAEIDFCKMGKAGAIKRSQVIKQIFDEYPILCEVSDQDEIIKWIDEEINTSLKTLREIVKQNQTQVI